MSTCHKVLIMSLFTVFAVAVKAQSISPQDAIVAAMKNSANDWNNGNLENFMKMYTDSSTMMYPTGPVGL
ncbi:MAG: hypothetical protein JST32_20230, partial [Bacteroidetes bacterium]|nr:hypothetical protein [Bacteroidota bacterium]